MLWKYRSADKGFLNGAFVYAVAEWVIVWQLVMTEEAMSAVHAALVTFINKPAAQSLKSLISSSQVNALTIYFSRHVQR